MRLNERYRMFFMTILLFSMEFSVRIIAFLTLRKIGILILLLLLALKNHFKYIKLNQKEILVTMLLAILFLYTVLIVNVFLPDGINISEGVYRAKNVLIMMLNMIAFPLLLTPLFSSTLQFAKCQWYVTLIQAAIILIGRISLNFRMFIFRRFAYGDGRLQEGIENGVRSVGIDLAGSTGSIVLFAGLMCAIYIFFHSEFKGRKKILVEYFIVMAALLFMGRLGLYLGLIGLFIVWWKCMLHRDICAKLIIFYLASGVGLIVFYIVVLAPNSYGLQVWIRWVTELLRLFDEQSTISVLRNMTIPGLTLETLFGTGLLFGTTPSGLVLNHDAGYIRMYTAIGLFGCLYYYGTVYGYFLVMAKKIKRRSVWRFYLFFILAIAIAEMKEPFLGKTPLVMLISCMLMLETQQTSKLIKGQ